MDCAGLSSSISDAMNRAGSPGWRQGLCLIVTPSAPIPLSLPSPSFQPVGSIILLVLVKTQEEKKACGRMKKDIRGSPEARERREGAFAEGLQRPFPELSGSLWLSWCSEPSVTVILQLSKLRFLEAEPQ